MPARSGSGKGTRVLKRWSPAPILAGLGLVVIVTVTSASTAAPAAMTFHWSQLSPRNVVAAYPEIAVGTSGLVVAVWTEGADPLIDKHNGPLKLAWVTDASTQWEPPLTLDGNKVFDVAVAVSGLTTHVVWSREKSPDGMDIYYTICGPPPHCLTPSYVTSAAQEALQLEIVVDGVGIPHIVWVEENERVYYSRKLGQTWRAKEAVVYSDVGSEEPALAYAGGHIHLVWTEWQVAAQDTALSYCRRAEGGSSWINCRDDDTVGPLADWPSWEPDYLARNPSVAGDGDGNIYVVWDMVSRDDGGSKRQYAIGYRHSEDGGVNWKDVRTYPRGNRFGEAVSGTKIFRSGEGDDQAWPEYIQFLRPHITMVTSDTLSVPVLAWHAEVDSGGGGEEGLAGATFYEPHKVFWTYATQPGSDYNGYMYWADVSDINEYTLSTDLCGDVNMNADSATGRVAVVGDLANILGDTGSSDYLHTVYHEELGGGYWGVIYNNSERLACFRALLPLMSRNSSGGGDD